ncbi:MAG: hypothetical protein ACTSWA_04765 [Candidatus Thorarchaeota archaeon]
MAFEENLGNDPSQPFAQDHTVSATGLISRTLSILKSKFIQYLIIVGIIGAGSIIFSFVLLYSLFGTIGILGADPISYLISLFVFASSPDSFLVTVSLGFVTFAFVLNAILGGAAIKFTLDEYGGTRGDVGTSFSHSIGRLLNILIVQLVMSSMVAVVITPSTILSARAMEMIDISDIMNPIIPLEAIELIMQSMGLLLVGGIILIYLQIRLAPTLAIVIDTDLSAFDSMKKSWELTSGSMMHVFGGWILLGIVTFVLTLLVSLFSNMTLLPLEYLLVIDSVIVTLFFGALSYIFTVVLYRDLASRKGTSNLPEYVM